MLTREEVLDPLTQSHRHMRDQQARNGELAAEMDTLRKQRAGAGEIAWALAADVDHQVCAARAEAFSLAAASIEVVARHLNITLPGTPEAVSA